MVAAGQGVVRKKVTGDWHHDDGVTLFAFTVGDKPDGVGTRADLGRYLERQELAFAVGIDAGNLEGAFARAGDAEAFEQFGGVVDRPAIDGDDAVFTDEAGLFSGELSMGVFRMTSERGIKPATRTLSPLRVFSSTRAGRTVISSFPRRA